ncbi:YraN family protein [uncultured Pseudoramibacter sp.]|jgi:putative endonuclease|uniref:UPF0102 protein FRC53_05090 n=1 Tax=Candidatus Pseudoramibacter fermentans TaxID=2594427 RepID=A0A6L5GR99_9FIRM|nr:YraN family protein [uncultured Pseudoramibacter sp.]MQM72791.1 YraN family protein [Candidatus Pseudoramibacter fermentans]RRF93854.1 MAG: YraN family protein [Eubacteriaceae bacterium]
MDKKLNRKKGNWAEDVAAFYLEKYKNHQIVARNYSDKTGEIDIISKIDQMYVFTEVKYRANMHHGTPGQAVNFRKQEHIIRTAILYLQKRRVINPRIRFDVVEVVGTNKENVRVRHIENAFTSYGYYL